MDSRLKRIGMLLFEDCDLLDFAGPTAVFHSVQTMGTNDGGDLSSHSGSFGALSCCDLFSASTGG